MVGYKSVESNLRFPMNLPQKAPQKRKEEEDGEEEGDQQTQVKFQSPDIEEKSNRIKIPASKFAKKSQTMPRAPKKQEVERRMAEERDQKLIDKNYVVRLKEGIKVYKYHYTANKRSKCVLTFTDDDKVQWEHIKRGKPTGKCGYFPLPEIKGLVYGAFSSTFSAYQPRLLQQIQRGEHKKCAFYSWQCLSAKMEERTIDFVIPDRQDLWALLRLFQIQLEKDAIFHVRPGDTDQLMEEKRKMIIAKMLGKPVFQRKIREFNDPLFMYKLMRLKMMISYHSCVEDVSLKELLLSTILKTHEQLHGGKLKTQKSIQEVVCKAKLTHSSTQFSK